MEEKQIGALNQMRTEEIRNEYDKDKTNLLMRHALARNSISNVIFDSSSLKEVDGKFSIDIKTLPVANQKQSGRCWIFAGLNVLREIIAKKCGLDNFELSQNYISLYDKIEKANFALESLLQLAKRDHDDREFAYILQEPLSDGGQWDMFVNLVKKYGVMPKAAFPETYQSEGTRESDAIVNDVIRNFAAKAHLLLTAGKEKEARELKERTIEKIYFFFLNCFGLPPKIFDFEYRNKEGYHVERNLTPKVFFEKYIGNKIDDYQSLIHSPTIDKPYLRNYTIDYLGNVIEGKRINHLNLPMERIKEIIVQQLSDNEVVWFGSDVSFYRDRNTPAWNDKAFDYMNSFGFAIQFDKAEMLDFKASAMNHAMVLTGVNLVDGIPTKWKIENSWGADNGDKGYYVMSSSFFDHFAYQAVVLKKYLTKEELEASSKEPVHLHPWDPMGTLAD
mgnify:CR=1 FL=1